MGYPTISNRARQYVRARSEAHMTCTVTIYASSGISFNETTGTVTSSYSEELYSGKARIYSIEGSGQLIVGDNVIATKTTYCSIPYDSAYIPVDSVVVISDMPIDLENETTVWRVLSTDGGGLMRAVRRMQITAFTNNANWEE
jgi:hypothetical protein